MIARERPAPGNPITIAGWGDINPNPIGQTLPDTLQYVDEAVISNADCNAATSYDGAILDGMICMGLMAGGIDTCQVIYRT